jgi:hypothetical protein
MSIPNTFYTDEKYRKILEALDGAPDGKPGPTLTVECGFTTNMKFAGAVAQLVQRELVENHDGIFCMTEEGRKFLPLLREGKVRTETTYKVDISGRIDLQIWKDFQKAVIDKHGGLDPYKNLELEQALTLWVQAQKPK